MLLKDNKNIMNFKSYKQNFPLKEKEIYKQLFTLHRKNIKLKKEKFAINNLEKIFKATFKISSVIGFHKMSLRDLTKETGLSMGGIYSCIESKTIIAIMIKDVVKLVTSEVWATSLKQADRKLALRTAIRESLYASQILQHWFYFLYMETHSLPKKHQDDAKLIETSCIENLEQLLAEIDSNASPAREHRYHFIAIMILTMVQEYYLKPWKYKKDHFGIDEYAEELERTVYSALTQ